MTAIALVATLLISAGAAAGPMAPGQRAERDIGLCRIVADEKNSAVFEELEQTCEEDAGRIFEQLGIDVGAGGEIEVIEVRVVADPWKMVEHSPPGLVPPDWSGAIAYPERGIVIIALRNRDGSPVTDLAEVLEHELSHMAMRTAIGPARVPRWFSEGVAIQQSEGSSIERSRVMWLAAMGDRLLPLEAIERYPAGHTDVTLAYAQAADFVGYLLSDSGWHGIRVVLNRLAAGDDFEDAFETAYDSSVARMEKGWRGEMASDFSWLAVVTGSGALWGAIAILFIMAYFTVRRRGRVRMAEMEEEEEPLERLISVVEKLEKTAGVPAGEPGGAQQSPPKTKIEVDGEIHTLH